MKPIVTNNPLSTSANNDALLMRPSLEKSLVRSCSPWLEPPETFRDYTRYFGMNVERIRREAKMSRDFLASLACISRSTLMRVERGWGDPRLSYMCYLSQALDTTVWDLLSAPPRVYRSSRVNWLSIDRA